MGPRRGPVDGEGEPCNSDEEDKEQCSLHVRPRRRARATGRLHIRTAVAQHPCSNPQARAAQRRIALEARERKRAVIEPRPAQTTSGTRRTDSTDRPSRRHCPGFCTNTNTGTRLLCTRFVLLCSVRKSQLQTCLCARVASQVRLVHVASLNRLVRASSQVMRVGCVVPRRWWLALGPRHHRHEGRGAAAQARQRRSLQKAHLRRNTPVGPQLCQRPAATQCRTAQDARKIPNASSTRARACPHAEAGRHAGGMHKQLSAHARLTWQLPW